MSWNVWRKKLAYPLVGVLIVLNVREPSKIGIAVIMLGMLLRLWASGYLTKRAALITAGPYGFVRNPLYLGSLIIGIGFCVMVRNIWLAVISISVLVLAYYRQIGHEERQLEQIFKDQYREYTRNVKRVFPRLYPYRTGNGGQFSFRNIWKNREYNVALGVVGILLVMDIYEDIIYPFFVKHLF